MIMKHKATLPSSASDSTSLIVHEGNSLYFHAFPEVMLNYNLEYKNESYKKCYKKCFMSTKFSSQSSNL